MNWSVKIKDKAVKSLAKIDRKQAARIWRFLEVELPEMPHPRSSGKSLHGEFKGMWRYRVGDYRILCEIIDDELVVVAIEVEHRSKVYK
jgi:mRNA interferase RelE/StbE